VKADYATDLRKELCHLKHIHCKGNPLARFSK